MILFFIIFFLFVEIIIKLYYLSLMTGCCWCKFSCTGF